MILRCLGLIGLGLIGWGICSAFRMLHPKAKAFPIPASPPSFRTVSLLGDEGAPFDVWVLDARDPRGVVVACHGYHANPWQLIATADGLRRRGHTVIAFELRGHGSRHDACTFGVRDTHDVGVILNWVSQQPPLASLRVGFYGLSLGGAIACQAAAQYPRCGALVLDSAYARLFPILAQAIRRQYHLPTIPWAWITWMSAQLALRRRLAQLDPAAVAERSRVPLLLIHGAGDQTVPLDHARLLYDRWQGPKELWIEPRAAHVGIAAIDPTGYCDRVAHFFDQWLTRHPSSR